MIPDPTGHTPSGLVAPGFRNPHAVARAWQDNWLIPSSRLLNRSTDCAFPLHSISPVLTSTARREMVPP